MQERITVGANGYILHGILVEHGW